MVKRMVVKRKLYVWSTKEEVVKKKLKQLYKWLPNNKEQRTFLQNEYTRIRLDKTRVLYLVEQYNTITLYANDISERKIIKEACNG
jgi:hypothetical protein